MNLCALVRNKTKAKNELPLAVKLVEHIADVDFNNIDVVVNLAGEPIAEKRWTKTQKYKICHSRWEITKAISDAINEVENPPELFISGSAIGIYGRQGSQPITESFADFHKEFTHTVCETWETIADLAMSQHTRVCILRTGIVLDKSKGALNKMLPAFKLGLGGPISNGRQMMSWIHIDDMTRGIVHIINNKSISGKINFTAPTPVTNEDFSKTLCHLVKKPCIFRVPKPVLRLLLGEMSDLLLWGQNVIPEKLSTNGFEFEHKELSSALQNLID